MIEKDSLRGKMLVQTGIVHINIKTALAPVGNSRTNCQNRVSMKSVNYNYCSKPNHYSSEHHNKIQNEDLRYNIEGNKRACGQYKEQGG